MSWRDDPELRERIENIGRASAQVERVKTRNRQRADRINERVDMGSLMLDYGYEVVPDDFREQQYRCDLHGMDNKPSARFYPRTNSTFCFACQKSRGPIDLVMDKEGLAFGQALDRLEKANRLPPLPWPDEVPPEEQLDEIEAIQHAGSSFTEEYRSLNRFLDMLISDRDLDLPTLLKYTEALDRIGYGFHKEEWSEDQGKRALRKLHGAVVEAVRATHSRPP